MHSCKLYKKLVLAMVLVIGPLLVKTESVSARTVRVRSVKSLTHLLSRIEKQAGPKARYTTIRLQFYLEDVYISQGTPVRLRPNTLIRALYRLVRTQNNRQEISRIILERYKQGEFHD